MNCVAKGMQDLASAFCPSQKKVMFSSPLISSKILCFQKNLFVFVVREVFHTHYPSLYHC